MLIDLHTHSRASDGSLTPTELVKQAAEKGIGTLSLTDHDTVDGVAEAVAAGEKFGVTVIPGVELSVNHELGSLHLLGYGIDVHDKPFLETVNQLRCSRNERNTRILARLEELRYPVSAEAVAELAGTGSVGRGHIGKALMNAGYFSSVEKAFEALLNRGSPAYVDRFRLLLKDAVALIHHAGGVAVWAHPGLHHEELPAMLELLPRWVEYGLDGLESDYSQHTLELRDRLRHLALQHGLIYTGGSDFHGDLKPDIRLGEGPEGMVIDERCIHQLLARISHALVKAPNLH